ncbi:LysR family transcriptional regulator [Rhodococcus triatomae]|uniref:DNA-binding transcriptional regulator, LysR family n=1 Tax=Rhodococcus triatomae TaxID=300028 RepID=A0A1G8MPU2_9NOCA|nr:LysR substrate-binding domain-containing protein [Rhodococcus triatomae]QNG19056.1 LysR family transcriptional regulator [Rhodococcus triatomae]QNG25031.1 LysR family transcriptional regulator [Rhodococcus triatomae]SDI70058.1 DNA-binding transcriptional regulator, LysR family [Rhodococcus triatomae]
MELRQLHAFLAVAEELHFGRAAERLHLAQSPLSQTIRALERELGARLFERTTRSVRLTAAGEALLTPARIIDAQVDAARRVTRAAGAGETGRVSVGFGGASGYAVLSALTRELAESSPGIELDLRPQMYSGEVVESLARGTLDMGIVGLPVPAGLATRVVRRESLVLAVPDGHALATRAEIVPADLAGERFVAYPSDHGSVVRDATTALCADAGFAPVVAHEAPDPYSLLAMVGAGLGVAVVVQSTVRITLDGVVYVPLMSDAPTLPIALAWDGAHPSPAVRTVVRLLDAVVDG